MDFQHRYYKINKIMLMMIGHWPYQSMGTRRCIWSLWLLATTGHIIAEIAASIKYRKDMLILLECVSPLFFSATCITKELCLNQNSEKMLQLMNHILADWKVWSQDSEADILHRYADHGRKLTIVYTVAIYSVGFIFMSQPIIPKIIDVILKNGSEPGKFPVHVHYPYFDIQKYYFYVVMYSFVCGGLAVFVTVAIDCMFIVYVQHGCGVFAALGYIPPSNFGDVRHEASTTLGNIFRHKLERLGINEISVKNDKMILKSEDRNMDFEYLVSCINRHNDAIKYAELLQASYLWSFFFIVGLNTVMISISGLQIVEKINHPEETMRFAVWLVSDLIYHCIESYMAQILMDHSISIRYCIHNSKWYNLSPKAQKLLPFMLMRCNMPCKLTAGKIIVMSMESLTKFIKASVSYFTLMRSM